MNALSTIDSDLFLFLNGIHAEWMDRVMTLLTDMWVWLPLYLLLIYWAVKQYGKRCWWVFLAVGVVVLCSDQLASHVCKPLFQRLRPCYNTDFQDFIHLPIGKAGGKYGFVSSHAANTFAVAAFLTPALRIYRPWVGIILYLWAFVSSYSRIYIGYHYPGDIVCGALLGLLVGLIIWKLFQRLVERKLRKSEQGI
ncbi:MAG: phosphatase PAP2 family protein [Bacteroidales bacterium]|nr:phosphatase PAP2 family protein [Bacteroidales bacterium]